MNWNNDDDEERPWQVHKDKMPIQRNEDGTINMTDCGVFTCAAMRRLMLNASRPRTLEDWGFTGRDGTRWRYRLIQDLAAGKIIEKDTALATSRR